MGIPAHNNQINRRFAAKGRSWRCAYYYGRYLHHMKPLNIGIKIELVGMGILLASTAWTFFFSDTLSYIFQDSYFYRIDEKLNSMWFVLSEMYTHSESYSGNALVVANFESLAESWKGWREGQESLRTHYQFTSRVGGWFFLLGSGLIILGKYLNEKGK